MLQEESKEPRGPDNQDLQASQDHRKESLQYFRPGTYNWIFIWKLKASLRIRVNLEHTWSLHYLPGTDED